MMVTNVLGEQSFQMAFIQRNNVVQQVSSTASHPPLRTATRNRLVAASNLRVLSCACNSNAGDRKG
jgi:hypothetical protein